MAEDHEVKGLAEPFRGITTDGKIVPGLFEIRPSGVSTEPVRNAAERFITTRYRLKYSQVEEHRAKPRLSVQAPQ